MKYAKIVKIIDAFTTTETEIKRVQEFLQFYNHPHMIFQADHARNKDVPFIYSCLFHYNFLGDFTIMKILHKRIKELFEDDAITYFDIMQLISDSTTCLEIIKENKDYLDFFLNKLLPRAFEKKGLLVSKNGDLINGLFSLFFFKISILQIPKYCDEFYETQQKNIDELIRKAIRFDAGKNLLSPLYPAIKEFARSRDDPSPLLDLHMIQLTIAIHHFYCFYKDKDSVKADFFLTRINKIKDLDAFKEQDKNVCSNDEATAYITSSEIDSCFQRRVYYLLRDIILKSPKDVIFEKRFDCFYYDVFVGGNYNVAFECNGRQHYRGGKLKLNSIRKMEYLEKVYGYKAYSIDVNEWSLMNNQQQEAYLRKLLNIK